MTVVGILWVVLTPYFTGLLIASSRRANRLVTRHLRVSSAVGWAGLATLFAGVFAVGGHEGMLAAVVSAPLAGLAFWKTAPGGDDDDGPAAAPAAHAAPHPSDRPPPGAEPYAHPHLGERAPACSASARSANMCSCPSPAFSTLTSTRSMRPSSSGTIRGCADGR
jgi:hypothetical protein